MSLYILPDDDLEEVETCRTGVPSRLFSKSVYKPLWHTPVPNVQSMNSWWWAEELPETCMGSFFGQNKFGKLVDLLVLL